MRHDVFGANFIKTPTGWYGMAAGLSFSARSFSVACRRRSPHETGDRGRSWEGPFKLPLFGPFWDRFAELPKTGGTQAQFVEGAVNASETPERDMSVQLSGWMLMEAAHVLAANQPTDEERAA